MSDQSTHQTYRDFLRSKGQIDTVAGFDPLWMPEFLFDFQKVLVEWAIKRGRAALFADCGMGKTPMQLVWAQNVIEHTGKPVLILTPLAVAAQTEREAKKFDIPAYRSSGDHKQYGASIIITNYEKLHHFEAADFSGVVCDESSAIKNFEGKRKEVVTEFMRTLPYRLLCTATASPNDYIELGTSSEALGQLGRMDMLSRFFKNDENSTHPIWWGARWRFKQHAEQHFWRWICSWARAIRKPSDFGFEDGEFVLPSLIERETIVGAARPRRGMLFDIPAETLQDQREERRITIVERCDEVRRLTDTGQPAVVWCHLNDEADRLEQIIPGAVQVSGSMSDDEKESRFERFSSGDIRVLVTKPKIGAFGLNWQHCNHMTFFPSHSFEQYYQGVRRCWRFGQTQPVTVDIVTSKGEIGVMKNLQRKAIAADKMFTMIVQEMQKELNLDRTETFPNPVQVPSWL